MRQVGYLQSLSTYVASDSRLRLPQPKNNSQPDPDFWMPFKQPHQKFLSGPQRCGSDSRQPGNRTQCNIPDERSPNHDRINPGRLMSYIYMEHPFLMFLDHTQRSSTVGRTPLDEWSARRRDLYLTTHDTHNRQISMPRWDSNPRSQQTSCPAARLLRYWVRIPPGAWIFVCCECRVLSGRGLCDELVTRPEESYRLWCVVVCDLETSRMGAQYIYDISSLRVKFLVSWYAVLHAIT